MTDPKPAKTKSRVMKPLLFGVAALMLVGAGAAAGVGLVSAGMLGGRPVKAHEAEAPTTSEAHYYVLEQGFTANLRDSSTFVQASVAVSSRGDAKVAEAVKANEPAMRSIVLQALAEQDYNSVATPAGRKALQTRLRAALDAELKAKVGFGGIDNVYFTAFVLQ